MKKVFSLLLVLAMCLSLFACTKADSPEPQPEEKKLWTFDGTHTDDANKTVSTEISVPVSGSYRNADTSDGELGGKITIDKFVHDGLSEWYIHFHILEEDNTSIDFSEDDVRNNKIVLKATVDDYTEENFLKGIPFATDLSFVDDRSNDGKGIYDSLYDGKNVDCVISVGYSSEYKFTIECGGFIDACVEAGFVTQEKADIDAKPVNSTEDIIDSFFLIADQTKRNDALAKNLNSYKLLNNDEVKALFDGCLVTVGTNTYGSWNMYNFRPDGNFTSAGIFINGGKEFLASKNTTKKDRPWSCENGMVTLTIDNTGTKDAATYQVRMLKEGYYILNVAGNDIPTHLLIQANEDGTFAYSYK